MGMRYILFSTYIQSQKESFRVTAFKGNNSKLKTLCFSESMIYKNTKEFTWEKKGKELVVNGVYHEIVSIKKTGGEYEVVLLEDKKENEILKQFFKGERNSKSNQSAIIFLLQLNFVVPGQEVRQQDQAKQIYYLRMLVIKANSEYTLELIKPPQSLIS